MNYIRLYGFFIRLRDLHIKDDVWETSILQHDINVKGMPL